MSITAEALNHDDADLDGATITAILPDRTEVTGEIVGRFSDGSLAVVDDDDERKNHVVGRDARITTIH